jgi:ABC-type branched-subunit amino acid transport system ATPase component
MVMRTCDKVVVLNFGRKLAEGTPRQIAADPGVVEAYLGTPA